MFHFNIDKKLSPPINALVTLEFDSSAASENWTREMTTEGSTKKVLLLVDEQGIKRWKCHWGNGRGNLTNPSASGYR